LEKKHLAAYAVGHLSNDLCAAGWFFYLVFYLKFIVNLSPGQAGLAMLSGQFADGFMTPLVGALSDKIRTRIGSRTPWYIFGTIIVLPSFFALFLHPFSKIEGENQDGQKTSTGELIYYMIFPAVFNIGWASVQIANMSLVNSLTYSTQRRDKLVSSRNTFTFIANISVLLIALILFQIIKDGIWQYRILAIIIVSLGSISSLFYLLTLKEPYLVGEAKRLQKEFKMQQSGFHLLEKKQKEGKKSVLSQNIRQWYQWFKEGQFYVYGFVYMLVRIAVNVIMSVQSFYLIKVLRIPQSEENPTPVPIAMTPLVSYIVSLLFQLFLYDKLTKMLKNRFLPMLVAIVIVAVGSIPMLFLQPSFFWVIYICSPIT
jgi:Na+/melibiose symporter-like transporter